MLSKEDHPRGLSPEERREWHKLCDRLLELYDKMPLGKTKRKVIAGGSDKTDAMVIFFKGNETDLSIIRDVLS